MIVHNDLHGMYNSENNVQNETWVVFTGGVTVVITSHSAKPRGRYGAKFAEFSITRQVLENGEATEVCISGTESAIDF